MKNNLPLSIKEAHSMLSAKKISSVELTKHFLARAKKSNSQTNAYITIAEDLALKQAQAADEMIRNHGSNPLCGIPMTMKDVYLTPGVETTAASHVLQGYMPHYEATVYRKLKDQGAVLIGKNNQDAWGHGGSSENNDYGPVHNPWDLERVAGGSGGGTAAALASHTAIYGIGEDTGGSIRNPAAYSNLTGLKVTYGRVSRYGAIAYASSFDTMGPTTRSAEDAALVLETIAGNDENDASSSKQPVPNYSQTLTDNLQGKKIGIVPSLMHGIDKELEKSINEAMKVYEKLGCQFREITLPTAKHGHAIYYVLVLAETSSNLARYDGIRYGHTRDKFTNETMRRIMTGTYTLSAGYYDAYYRRAQQARTLLIQEFTDAFTSVDAILLPVMPFPPYKIGGIKDEFDSDNYAVAMYLADIYTCLANTVGIPSIAFPIGFTNSRLPLSMQLHGPMFSEGLLLNLTHQYQLSTDWHLQQPPILGDEI